MNRPLKTCLALIGAVAAVLLVHGTTFAQLACPNGQHFDGNSNQCSCRSGMVVDDKNVCSCKQGFALAPTGTYCFRLPSHAHGDSKDADGWLCDTGYQKQGNSCTKIASSSVIPSSNKSIEILGSAETAKVKSTSRNRRLERQLRRSKASTQTQQASSSSQSSSASSFPISLLNNQKWSIRIVAPVDAQLMETTQDVFAVERDNELLSVTTYERDLKTGNLRQSFTPYKARFSTSYFPPHELYLEIYNCFFEYKYIREGLICSFNRIPSKLMSGNVKGDKGFEILHKSSDYDFAVEVLSKSPREVSCNIKGEIYQKEHIYHLQGSTFFNELESGFRCFSSEQEAIGAGYKKSLQ